MPSSYVHETRPDLVSRVTGRLARAWRRFRFERLGPELSAATVAERFQPASRVNVAGLDGFRALFGAHLAATPTGLWDQTPPLAPDELERVRRGEIAMFGRHFIVDARTDWHVDPLFAVRWPRRHVDSMPFVQPGSDLVLLWHLNKTLFLLDRAGAYRATGDGALARDVYAIMDAWCTANPFMVGANWISPMEAGTRLVAWSQALAGLRGAAPPDNECAARIIRALFRQADIVAENFSQWVIPNNHLIGEAATLFAFYAYWPELMDSSARRAKAEQILLAEAERQILADGFSYECSVNYHLYVLDWLLLYLHARVLLGEAPPPRIVRTATAMAAAAVALVAPSGRWPAIGDDSIEEFFALDPGGFARERTAEVAFAGLLKPAYLRLFATVPWAAEMLAVRAPIAQATHLADAGITVARDADSHLVFVHGPQHRHLFANGHMHADAGSFELELDGHALIVDAGTYLYARDAATRGHFRGARAHNAPLIDGVEPMEGTGPFAWATVAKGEYLGSGTAHDLTGVGCRRRLFGEANSALEHTRALVRAGEVVLVVDGIRPRPGAPAVGLTHTAVLGFRTPLSRGTAVAEGSRVRLTDAARFVRVMECFADAACRIDVVDDPADPLSWHSPRYGELRTGVTVRVAADFEATLTVVTAIHPPDVAVTPLELTAACAVIAVASAHRRRVVRVHMDPFLIASGGYALVGRDGGGALPPGRTSAPALPPSDLTWLDDLS
ncbi:MAG TPA: alginate lyase family protein [Candidatus Krumholzibacteria bacterium]|nr:alginate lyase family protein [Candidatus Krumholzibacteria bacterium]